MTTVRSMALQVLRGRRGAGWAAAGLLSVLIACGEGGPTTPTTPTPAPTPVLTPTTTAAFDGRWAGTATTGEAISFRVLSGQVTDFTTEINFGSGCLYRARTPSTFDPVDAVFPIGTDGRLRFQFRDPALVTIVNLQFTALNAGRGTIDATPLLAPVFCSGRTVGAGQPTPALSFTVARS